MSLGGMIAALLVACTAGATDKGSAPQARPAQASPAPRVFASTSPWYQRLRADAPVALNSTLVVGQLQAQLQRVVPWINTTSYSTPVYTVSARRKTVAVQPDTGNHTLRSAFAAVPLPARARAANGTDGSLVVYQPATDTLWEFWRLRLEADGWHAAWGGRIDSVSTSTGVFDAPYGTSASGLGLLGGLIRPHELRAGRIDHALALGVPNTAPSFVPPATRSDGQTVGGIPLGTRLRLDPDVDVDALGLPRPVATIARAAQEYGIYVRDTSGSISFYAQDPVNLRADPWPRLLGFRSPHELLARFPWSRLQVVAP